MLTATLLHPFSEEPMTANLGFPFSLTVTWLNRLHVDKLTRPVSPGELYDGVGIRIILLVQPLHTGSQMHTLLHC